MADVTVLIFHRRASDGEPVLLHTLAEIRGALAARHSQAFVAAGASTVTLIDEWHVGLSFGEVLARLAPRRGGMIALSSGAVPLLNARDAKRLVDAAAASERVALTNNRYSSDIIAVANAPVLRGLPPLPSDNALPRWLEERAGYAVFELGSRDRLGVDLDTPLDVALAARAPSASAWLRGAASAADLVVPRLDELHALAANPYRELLVFGRSSSSTLRWLERNVRCRVRFLAEERGMRAASPLAIGGPASPESQRPPIATLGILLAERGPEQLSSTVAELADGAIIDTRVLIAHRLGADEASWPSAADRFASDLHLAVQVGDPWLSALTASAAGSALPMLLGGHSLVGPGIPLVLSQVKLGR